ncbi:MAG: hypothetical protein R3310_13365, partial [Candidatus Competibacteraceae bacterium]|nr:hypothetical protein [Candidatus Competibacteraceae bacterium]
MLLFVILVTACNHDDNGGGGANIIPTDPSAEPRAFRMGMTPFAPQDNLEVERRVWDFLLSNADLVALHFDSFEGLPWGELGQGRVPENFAADYRNTAARARGRTIYAAITPLNNARDGVAETLGGNGFPADLGPAAFSNPRVVEAFLTYARFVADTLQPRYLAVGIEVNLYAQAADPNEFMALVDLYKTVYRDLKQRHPNLVIFPTFQVEFMHGLDQWALLNLFMPEMDRIGLSLYPSGAGFTPAQIPGDWLTTFQAFVDRPLVVAETGYGSRPFDGSNFDAPGSETLQSEYLRWLIDRAEVLDMDFLVWFFPTDTPNVLPPELMPVLPPAFADVAFFFRMGLLGEDFEPKPVFAIWEDHLSRPLM